MGYTRWAHDLGCAKIAWEFTFRELTGAIGIFFPPSSTTYLHISPRSARMYSPPRMLANISSSFFVPFSSVPHPPSPSYSQCLVQAERLIIIVILAFVLPLAEPAEK